MSGPAAEDRDGSEPVPSRRRYESGLRRERAAQTRERILEAGSALVHGFPAWDWRELTFRAVAARAGVGQRTVYRYFPTERDLHDAIMRRLEEESGVSYEGLDLDRLPEVTARALAALSSYAVPRWTDSDPDEPTLVAEDRRRREALAVAVAEHTADWSEAERQMATGMLDVLWHVPSYERLITGWNLDVDQATRAISWAIGLLADAIRDGRGPNPIRPTPPTE